MKANKLIITGRQLLFNAQRFYAGDNALDVEGIKRAREARPFMHSNLEITRVEPAKALPKPKPSDVLKFGQFFSDHMFEVDWNSQTGWGKPKICPIHDLSLHPGAKCLHYAIELFEGMKAYRGIDGKIRLFRPEQNMERMRRSAFRSALPDFSSLELLKCIKDLVALDKDWVPAKDASLYLRPTMIGTDKALGVGMAHKAKLFVVTGPVGAYFPGAVTLLADPDYVRAFEGGVGSYKMGCNYAPSIMVSTTAMSRGCHQVLWLYGKEEYITEVGTMNIMMYWKNEKGEEELVTPPIDNGLILPGVTRDSLIKLAKSWDEFLVSERYIGMKEIRRAVKEKRLYEMFGTGTACVVSPVGRIIYKNKALGDYEELSIPTEKHQPNVLKRLYKQIIDIQFGAAQKPGWTQVVC
uniref:branched-chain-amino-acid transaminase n=1 Tax=Syphacia muris TaxID=451379 RepID=A0A0N5AAI1_9BILA